MNPGSWRTVDGEPIAEPERIWLFQANPKVFDFVGWLEKHKPGDTGTWTVMAYWKRMKEGDPVIFWVSGKDGGIYALAGFYREEIRDFTMRQVVGGTVLPEQDINMPMVRSPKGGQRRRKDLIKCSLAS